MKVRLPLLVQDLPAAATKGMRPTEEFTIELDDVFLDGPVTGRLAVLDFDSETNTLRQGAPFRQPARPDEPGRYDLGPFEGVLEDAAGPFRNDIDRRHFNQVSAFATVVRTMDMFEDKEVLGRPLRWAFDGPQLLIVPRAGEWANAFYERESHSLQFFYFPSVHSPDRTVYTSLSHDIIAHECGHAILDGIAPDLYNAVTPQSLGLHEAIADLIALVMAFRTRTLSETVLEQTDGSIENSTAFTRIAEEFGYARDPAGRAFYLRSLLNEKTLDPTDTSVDELGLPNFVKSEEPHELSQVLSGALYKVMVRIHEELKREYARRKGATQRSVSGLALFVGVQRFKRMLFRALDYLPPGEVSFADYARAVIAADQASHPADERERDWIREEFVRRCIVPDETSLEPRTGYDHPALANADIQALVASDWVAYQFANANRDLLRIPPEVPFRVLPRLDAEKLYYRRGGRTESVRECLFKVSWEHLEPNPPGSWFPAKRRVTVGTTLAIDWETKRIRAVLTSDFKAHRAARDRLLARLDAEGTLLPAAQAMASDGRPLQSVILADSADGVMRVRGAARMLHVAPGVTPEATGG